MNKEKMLEVAKILFLNEVPKEQAKYIGSFIEEQNKEIEEKDKEIERLKRNIENAKKYVEQHRIREMSVVEVNAMEGILNE